MREGACPARRLLNAASKRSNSGLAIRTIVVVEQQKPFTAAQLAADIDVWEQGKTFADPSFRFKHNDFAVPDDFAGARKRGGGVLADRKRGRKPEDEPN